MPEWRVYYSGGTSFSSGEGAPWDAPATGVQAIVNIDNMVGRVILSSCDYYWFDNVAMSWFCGDIAGLHQYLMLSKGPKSVLFGQYVSNEEFHRCYGAALADADFPAKSARHPSERP